MRRVSLPTLSGPRVRLRPWRPDDVDAVTAACQDPEVQRWTRVPVPYARSDAEAFVGDVSAGMHREGGASFAVEGVLRQRSLHRGVPVDDVVLGLLASDPRPTA
jgi:RimJ/RimL family protein N-acetyltransferase